MLEPFRREKDALFFLSRLLRKGDFLSLLLQRTHTQEIWLFLPRTALSSTACTVWWIIVSAGRNVSNKPFLRFMWCCLSSALDWILSFSLVPWSNLISMHGKLPVWFLFRNHCFCLGFVVVVVVVEHFLTHVNIFLFQLSVIYSVMSRVCASQSTDQCINQSINQSIKRWTYHSFIHSLIHSLSHSFTQSVNWLVGWSVNRLNAGEKLILIFTP